MKYDAPVLKELDPASKILMGPGPSDTAPRVLRAMSAPCLGHLDPDYLKIMDEIQQLLRYVFQTKNALTIPVSGTGSAGMETCLVNLVEPGDTVLVCMNGYFGMRQAEMVGRMGGKLVRLDFPWGRAVDPEAVRQKAKEVKPKIIAMVHAETSTGVCSPIADVAKVAKEVGALFLVDAVTSLGCIPVEVDEIGIDAVYSCTQKGISCPPGLAPISFSDQAVKVLQGRKTPVISWYLDMSLVASYYGTDRKYHHTAPINMNYGIREALRIIAEEGLENRYKRHLLNHRALVAGVEAMGLSMLVPEAERLPQLNTIRIPEGVKDLDVRKAMLNEYGIEIGGGLGDLAGKIWRVGIMGTACTQRNVTLFLAALYSILKGLGVKLTDTGLDAAAAVYKQNA